MGTWDEEPQSPHNNRFVHFDGQLGIDMSRSRTDGRCGKSANWAPCPLVPILNNAEATPCCNFGLNQCVTKAECTCEHCVDYASVNEQTVNIKQQIAGQAYNNDVFGILIENRDLFKVWAVENIIETNLLDDAIQRINTQTFNVRQSIENARQSHCINRDITSLNQDVSEALDTRIKNLQNQDLYPDVLKEILVEYLAKNTEVRCIRK